MRQQPTTHHRFARRGAVAAAVVVSGTILIGFTAIAVDVGMLYNVRTELQRSVDAGALAGATKLLTDDRLKGPPGVTQALYNARQAAVTLSGLNPVYGTNPTVDANAGNSAGGDTVLGYLANPRDPVEQISTSGDPARFNSVGVKVRRDAERNGSIPLLFAGIFGLSSKSMSATAVAQISDSITGYKVTSKTGNAQLLPFALHINAWNNLINGTLTNGDNYTYNSTTSTVSCGGDGIAELNLYPGSGTGQLPPGSFGTVDIGSPNNSTADITRQILYGVNESDLAYLGGELKFADNGELLLQGDTGLSAAVKDDLEAIKGQPRAIPIFTQVSGPGNNAVFTVVRFAGIRIMNVRLTGAMNQKQVIIQPAVMMDDAAQTGAVTGTSYNVYGLPRLVR